MAKTSLTHLYSKTACCAQPSAIREINKLVDQPDMKSLAGGWPDPAVFPGKDIIQIALEQLGKNADQVLQYGTTEGLTELRQELARLADTQYGIKCSPDHILVTHGSAQGMDLACRVMIDPGDIVAVGLPTYFGGTGAVSSAGGAFLGVAVDAEGMNTDQMSEKLRALKNSGKRANGIYVIPNFQNPTGTTMSLERRRQLIELSQIYDLVIFEDDPYGDLRFEGDHLPTLMALDEEGRVIHLRSMSKTFAPGLRIAWAIGQPDVVRKMVIAKQFVDVATNTLSQFILLEFIRRGLLTRQIELNKQHYRRKRDFMLEQLETHFPLEVKWNRPQGGFFIFVRLPETMDASELLAEAVKQNVAFVAGAPFFFDQTGTHTLRLSYSQSSEAVIEAAVARLGSLIRQQMVSH